jgi:hypothetical protein
LLRDGTPLFVARDGYLDRVDFSGRLRENLRAADDPDYR